MSELRLRTSKPRILLRGASEHIFNRWIMTHCFTFFSRGATVADVPPSTRISFSLHNLRDFDPVRSLKTETNATMFVGIVAQHLHVESAILDGEIACVDDQCSVIYSSAVDSASSSRLRIESSRF